MAKQNGIIKVKGTIGDMTFYKTKDGHLVREKGSLDAKRIATDPAFQRTRENGAEFGTAGKGGQLIRKGLRLLTRQASDKRLTSRLTKQLLAVVKTDPVNERGLRTIQDGDMALLEGFDFNENGKLNTRFFNGYEANFDRTAGTYEVEIDEFVPKDTIDAPKGTTHIQIVAGLCATDFSARIFEEDHEISGVLPWDNEEQPALTLSAAISADSTLPVLQVVGVNFFQEVNGEMYALRNGAYNALAIVQVSQL